MTESDSTLASDACRLTEQETSGENLVPRILFVDDEPNLLKAIHRQLRGEGFEIITADSPEEGLRRVQEGPPFAVIISDLRMPHMSGIDFLEKVQRHSPDSVRMMLTGYADLDNAVNSINRGHIFRFLVKPCEPDSLRSNLKACVDQYRLIRAEKELLDRTLKGCVELLVDLLNIGNPEAFVRSSRLAPLARSLARAAEVQIPALWEVETAALMSQVGWVFLPEDTMRRIQQGKGLEKDEKKMVVMHPQITSELLDHIPRMEAVSEIIASQSKHFDGSGLPVDGRKGEAIPLGARILKIVMDFDMLIIGGSNRMAAWRHMSQRKGRYDPNLLHIFGDLVTGGRKQTSRRMKVGICDLTPGMVTVEPIRLDKRILVGAGQTLTLTYIRRLAAISRHSTITEPVLVELAEESESNDTPPDP